ncbi:hypothetical protein Tco_0307363 [Tanacetum coccineum]
MIPQDQDPNPLPVERDNRDIVIPAQASQEIPTLAAFQTDDLDAFNSDCDDVPSSKAVLMANLSSYDSNVLSEVQQENLIVNETLTAELERYKEQVKIFEQRKKFDLNDREKYIDGQLRKVIVDKNAKVADFEKQIHSLKLQLNATVKSHKTLTTTVECSKKESKQKEDKYLGEFIDLQKKNKALDNVVYKMSQSTQTMHMLTKPQALYDTHDALYVIDTEETLELAEESRLKMLAKQNDPTLKEKKVNIALVDYREKVDPDHPEKVYHLRKALYGLKQAPRATEYQLADMFTKALSEDRFQYLVRRIGMRCLTPAELEVLTNESA